MTGAGGAVGGVASDIGATPDQVGTLGAEGQINPVSTALKCVINLTCQYMGIYTAIAIIRVVAASNAHRELCADVGHHVPRVPHACDVADPGKGQPTDLGSGMDVGLQLRSPRTDFDCPLRADFHW